MNKRLEAPPPELVSRAKCLVSELTLDRAAKVLGVHSLTLAKVAGGLPTGRGTFLVLAERLAAFESKTASGGD